MRALLTADVQSLLKLRWHARQDSARPGSWLVCVGSSTGPKWRALFHADDEGLAQHVAAAHNTSLVRRRVRGGR